jgi:hypothetical protein
MGSVSDWYPLSDELRRVLPEPACLQRCALLPLILDDWFRSDLPDHLSRESRSIKGDQINKLEVVRECARRLQEALKAIGDNGRTALLAQMMSGSGPLDKGRSESKAIAAWLEQESDFLEKVVAIDPREFWKPKRGRPRNLPAYSVLQDAAALFEWLSGIRATREVSRDDGTETGPFFHFASILWPTIFGNGVLGLPAAMKNWAELRKAHGEQSALIINMRFRHPEWGLFEP